MSNENESWEEVLSAKLKRYSAKEIESSLAEALSKLTDVEYTVELNKINFDSRNIAQMEISASEKMDFEKPD